MGAIQIGPSTPKEWGQALLGLGGAIVLAPVRIPALILERIWRMAHPGKRPRRTYSNRFVRGFMELYGPGETSWLLIGALAVLTGVLIARQAIAIPVSMFLNWIRSLQRKPPVQGGEG